jgi:hypothetical protein
MVGFDDGVYILVAAYTYTFEWIVRVGSFCDNVRFAGSMRSEDTADLERLVREYNRPRYFQSNIVIKPKPIHRTQKLHITLPSHERLDIDTTTREIPRTDASIDPLTQQAPELRP